MKAVQSDVHFPSLEKSILQFWKKNGIIEKGLEANKGKEPFVFYDGPPFATGLPHYGHILPGTLKDIVPRYWVMKGKYVQRRWGWDCHGLPVEFEMEKELGLQGLKDIEEYGIGKFNEACRNIVARYTKEWEEIIQRTGRWVDFKNSYRTMDTSFMETVWWVLRQLWDKGLVFEGYRVMPYSWRITTPLSNFEAGLNYKEIQDPSITLRLKSTRNSKRYFLAWTTTPWTLPSNLALAVHPEMKYVEVEDTQSKDLYVLCADRLSAYYRSPSEYRIMKEFSGKELEGETYEPLFPYFADQAKNGAFRIVLADYVTATDGTGIVHTAPAFGEDDFTICKKTQIPIVDPVDSQGNFTSQVPDYEGMNVKDADKLIIRDLKASGALIRHETVVHSYPFCWRSETPLIYKAISTWFIALDPIRQKLMDSNQRTHWVPEHLRDGRFGNWLENARDWNISRNRFWGTPIPIWRCQSCKHLLCLGSIDELEKLSGKRLNDIHKHFVDEIVLPCSQCGQSMKRIPEVLDCWFESGSMPYGQAHYPFENKERFEKNFPAHFIAEGVDQTRGWFYTLSVLSNALFGKPPFEHVIVNGLVLASDGKKMSKRLKNYPEPTYILDQYGADALRAYLTTSPACHAEDLKFSEAGVKEIVRSVLLPLWNAYSFFVTYALADGWDPEKFDKRLLDGLSNELDRWILSRLQTLIQRVDERMAVYHVYEVIPEVLNFIDELTNWYIRLNRRRYWAEEKSQDKEVAYSTLYHVLCEFSKILAPVLPFITEEIYQNLVSIKNRHESIHLCGFPVLESSRMDTQLEFTMDIIRNVVSMGRTCRNSLKLKTRQPLRELLVISKDPVDRHALAQHSELIAQELNVKKVVIGEDEAKWVRLTAKPNAKLLGPKLGSRMKSVSEEIRKLPPDAILRIESGEKIKVAGEAIGKEDVIVERQPKEQGIVQTSGRITVWLDSKLDESLIAEGRAREFVNRVQKMRKDMQLNVTDRIVISYQSSKEIKAAIDQFTQYIASETLADRLDNQIGNVSKAVDQEIDNFPLKLQIEKC
ncbi:MAG: isoleucine--tRNA ligase [Deltaproteobacteria bacterium]|nr:isoleucine--tRNA ligase [Deltaproteobacteria bacterium]